MLGCGSHMEQVTDAGKGLSGHREHGDGEVWMCLAQGVTVFPFYGPTPRS